MNPKMIHWMYTAIVRPMVAYASLVWFREAAKKTYILKLQKLQRLACLLITGAMKSTPTSALEVMLCLPPLHLYMKSKAKMINFKTSVDETHYISSFTTKNYWNYVLRIKTICQIRFSIIYKFLSVCFKRCWTPLNE